MNLCAPIPGGVRAKTGEELSLCAVIGKNILQSTTLLPFAVKTQESYSLDRRPEMQLTQDHLISHKLTKYQFTHQQQPNNFQQTRTAFKSLAGIHYKETEE
ncbi:hypothetical protein MJO29_002679 [Puccinia striiformis f. sp. tritici]|uniref:hypothetical protein n=1 Tax=Puccinia striiformis f. sp. tritici TaxID=168172 RepID=UPI0020077643|nr:hypothetical protein Pst134EA_005433 [Puccinia striiformis f. sp. tritici]KAH9471539.1 hypothetical protein Pst134EA_005433 [Puccinia striiformis f. sp. tritici]KAI7964581.1 hypothetical protein MJO29_002679 [Puccinia striiformis f. sp. tritici]